jgi:hypothetical protein
VRAVRHRRRDRPQLVTEARRPLSEDIAYRQRRYLIMMGIRVACFIIAVLVFVNHGGWLAAIPVVGAIAIPYFAVVFANGGREPDARRGFRPYEPSLPRLRDRPDGSYRRMEDGETYMPGSNGAPPRTGATGNEYPPENG